MDIILHDVCRRWNVGYQNVNIISSRNLRHLNFPLVIEREIVLEDEVSLRRLTQLL